MSDFFKPLPLVIESLQKKVTPGQPSASVTHTYKTPAVGVGSNEKDGREVTDMT